MASSGALEICVAIPGPTPADALRLDEAIRDRDHERLEAIDTRLHPLVRSDFDWPEFVRVRPTTTDTANCAAAFLSYPAMDPSHLSRFLDGAERRGETAIVVMEIATESAVVFTHPGTGRQIQADRLPDEPTLDIVEQLEPINRDFAERVLRGRDSVLPWFSVSSGQGEPIEALLADGLRAPVVALWIPTGKDQVWYLVPPGIDWRGVVQWLTTRAIPTLVPEVAARVRGLAATEAHFITAPERLSEASLASFDRETARKRKRQEEALAATKTKASEVRDPLLFEDGDALVGAVQAVLKSCRFRVENLDQLFGGGRSSDLLATHNGQHWLIEVRGKKGPARESDVADVVKHRGTWQNLRPEKLSGSVLVVNYQRQLPTPHRRQQPYDRPEFVEALPGFGVTVVGSLSLCKWWAEENCESIRKAITGSPRQYGLGDSVD